MFSFKNEKSQRARVDRTLDKIDWPTKSSNPTKTDEPPTSDVSVQVTTTSSEAVLIELTPRSVTHEGDDGDKMSTYFNLPVLIGDAHSLFRFTMYTRIPPEPKMKKGKKKVQPSEKKGEASQDVEVKTKLLPKVQNEPQPENLSVTIECSDSNV